MIRYPVCQQINCPQFHCGLGSRGISHGWPCHPVTTEVSGCVFVLSCVYAYACACAYAYMQIQFVFQSDKPYNFPLFLESMWTYNWQSNILTHCWALFLIKQNWQMNIYHHAITMTFNTHRNNNGIFLNQFNDTWHRQLASEILCTIGTDNRSILCQAIT